MISPAAMAHHHQGAMVTPAETIGLASREAAAATQTAGLSPPLARGRKMDQLHRSWGREAVFFEKNHNFE